MLASFVATKMPMDAAGFRELFRRQAAACLSEPLARDDPSSTHRVVGWYRVEGSDPVVSEVYLPSSPTDEEFTYFESSLANVLGSDPSVKWFINCVPYPPPPDVPGTTIDDEASTEEKNRSRAHWFGSIALVVPIDPEKIKAILEPVFPSFTAQVEVGSDNGYLHLQFAGHCPAAHRPRATFANIKSRLLSHKDVCQRPLWLRYVSERDFPRCSAYCQKEETSLAGCRVIHNMEASKPKRGKRTDLESLAEYMRSDPSFQQSNKRKRGQLLCEKFPTQVIKYHRGIEAYMQMSAEEYVPPPPGLPYPWQERMLGFLRAEPDPNARHIWWIWDSVGNRGKSTLVRFLRSEGVTVALFSAGSVRDYAAAYDDHQVVVFEIPRSVCQQVLTDMYSAAEHFKNGVIFSPKYHSGMKYFRPPHVVFLANIPPPPNVFSPDRLKDSVVNLDVEMGGDPSV